MNYLNSINSENFDKSFDLIQLLTNSMFYPASGVDGFDIEHSPFEINSFIHVDYSVSESQVTKAMREDFKGVGYKLIGLRSIKLEELIVKRMKQRSLILNQAERDRLKIDFIYNKYNFRNFIPFAIRAVYELDEATINRKNNKRDKFSLLHIGGEACEIYNQLYIANKLNPVSITLKRTGYGYGDNWTNFYDPNSCLNRLIAKNSVKKPEILLTRENCCSSLIFQ